MTPIDHAKEVIASVGQKTDRAILFYSCGKDSEVLLDLMAPYFREIVCVFMYFVKGLEHIDNYLNAVLSRYKNVTIKQVPHWTLTRVLRCGLYCIPNPNIKILSLKDVDASLRLQTGINYTFYGMKQADGLNRRLMLRGYDNEAISSTNKVYPLSKWSKADVMAYIKARALPPPNKLYQERIARSHFLAGSFRLPASKLSARPRKDIFSISFIQKYIATP